MIPQWTEEMNEITGLGGFYERCCRVAVTAGAHWCVQHPRAFDAEEVESAIRSSLVAADDGVKHTLGDELTPTQMALVMFHVRYIADNGWNKYRECMSARLNVYP